MANRRLYPVTAHLLSVWKMCQMYSRGIKCTKILMHTNMEWLFFILQGVFVNTEDFKSRVHVLASQFSPGYEVKTVFDEDIF